MSGTGDGSPLIVDAQTWPEVLAPDADTGELGEIDRGIAFDALVEFIEHDDGVDAIEVREVEGEAAVSADAPLLVPGIRIYVPAGEAARGTIQRLARMAVAVLIGADPAVGGIGVTVDVLLDVFNKASRLDGADFELLRAVIELREGRGADGPSETDLQKALPTMEDLPARLRGLAERGIVVENGDGWQVPF